MASASTIDLKLCVHCSNDQYEEFSQTELDDGELIIVCRCCDEYANPDLWNELLTAKMSATSTSDEIREQLMASAKDFVKEVKSDEVLPICFKIPCNCGGSDFRNVMDEEGMSTLAHVKVCNRCHNVMGVDENVLLEEVKDFLQKASFKTTACHGCGNTDPDQYKFEKDDENAKVNIRCTRCSGTVNGSSARKRENHERVGNNTNPVGPNPNNTFVDGTSLGSEVKLLTAGATFLDSIATFSGPSKAMGFGALVCIDLARFATDIADLQQAKDAGQIPHCTYVNGIVEGVGKSATKLLVAGAACLLPLPLIIGSTIGYCLGSIIAPAGGRAFVWAKDQAQHMFKNMRL